MRFTSDDSADFSFFCARSSRVRTMRTKRHDIVLDPLQALVQRERARMRLGDPIRKAERQEGAQARRQTTHAIPGS